MADGNSETRVVTANSTGLSCNHPHQHLHIKYFSECNMKRQLDNNVIRIPTIGSD